MLLLKHTYSVLFNLIDEEDKLIDEELRALGMYCLTIHFDCCFPISSVENYVITGPVVLHL